MAVFQEVNSDGRTKLKSSKVYPWHCRVCGTTGGKLGWAKRSYHTRFAYCPYCDQGTNQTTEAEDNETT